MREDSIYSFVDNLVKIYETIFTFLCTCRLNVCLSVIKEDLHQVSNLSLNRSRNP